MRASTKKQRRQLLSELENNPLIERACKKVGIARSTFYRWCDADPEFKHAAEAAIALGRDKMNDYVESKLLEAINAGNFQGMRYWLDNNSKRYGSWYMQEIKRLRGIEKVVHELLDSVTYRNGGDALLPLSKLRSSIKKQIEEEKERTGI